VQYSGFQNDFSFEEKVLQNRRYTGVSLSECRVSFSECRVTRSKKIQKPKFGHKQFKIRPNPQKLEKGQIFFKNLLK
jgi:hypothetical protein